MRIAMIPVVGVRSTRLMIMTQRYEGMSDNKRTKVSNK